MPLSSKQGAQNFQRPIVAKTAAHTITAAESGTLFTNRGATAAFTFTLPAVTGLPIGTNYSFYGVASAGYTVASNGSSDNIVSKNDVAADSITITTASLAISGAVRVIWDGTAWLAYQESVGPTYTVA
jgi:hypothetical protein